MRPRVLVLSGLYDFATDLVINQLNKNGTTFLRLNREQIQDFRICLSPSNRSLRITFEDSHWDLDSDLYSIWYRQPVFLRNTPPSPLSLEEQLNRSQWMAFLRSLIVFDDANWMNAPAKTYAAECKPYQLMIAKKCGFEVPYTIVTNDFRAIRKNLPGDFILKSLDTILLHEGNDTLFTYTTACTETDISDECVSTAPLIAQELIENKHDIRVTVIGDKVFASCILVDGKGIDGDWRIAPKELIEYRQIEAPKEVIDMCKSITKELELNFAAIDLLECHGKYYFIELNPTGEWAWLTSDSCPMDMAIASWLGGETP